MLALDGKPMENGRQLRVSLYRRLVGDVVMLEVLRDGQSVKVPIVMGERRDSLAGVSASIDPRQNLVPQLGILGVTLDERIATMMPVLRVRSGVIVASTVLGAIDSREGGLAAGDIVYAVNRTPVAALEELRTVLDTLKTGDPVVLQLERRGTLMYLAFAVD